MPIFRFRLAPVLRVRERHREAQRLALAEVENEQRRLLDDIYRLEQQLTAIMQDMARTPGEFLAAADLQLYGEFTQQLVRSLQLKRTLLAAVEERRDERRLALLEADKDVKSLEQLKHRLEARALREEAATAQRQTDEVGQRRHMERQRV
ncbi:MAG TPA: flagellar export protein FliJ [Methylomirabilota bacterium]|jgi:flagellar export protein FliJ|nr:flagellar export protein FliJ [Methylomirabilota bacterium]